VEKGIGDIVQKWIMKAEHDLKTAENAFNASEVMTDTLCFHCQQAAEKYLKAFLVSHDIVPEKTHEIARVLEACVNIDAAFEQIKYAVALTEYAVELRYPDDFYFPSLDESKTAYELALKVKAFVLERLK
jgi:HEPN domain-containing protein